MSAPLHSLQSALEHEVALVQRFIAILQAEAQALEHPDQADALNASTQDKNDCIDLLTKAGTARENALRALGFTPDAAGLNQAVETHPALADLGARLVQLGQQAVELNASNGAAIDVYLKHTQQALQALQPLVGGAGLYDASGRPGAVKGQRKTITAG